MREFSFHSNPAIIKLMQLYFWPTSSVQARTGLSIAGTITSLWIKPVFYTVQHHFLFWGVKKSPSMFISRDSAFDILPKSLMTYLIEVTYILTFVLFVSTKCWAIDFKITAKKNQECCSKEGKRERLGKMIVWSVFYRSYFFRYFIAILPMHYRSLQMDCGPQ